MGNTELTEITGIGEATAGVLNRAGFKSAEDIADAAIEDISAVPGFGYMRAQRTRVAARELVGSTDAEPAVADDEEAISVLGDAPMKGKDKKKKGKKKDKKKDGKKDKKKDKKKKGKKGKKK